jgi:hypothetical protein
MGVEEIDRMRPEVREKYLEMVRSIPPGKKIEITVAFCDTVREFVMDVIRSENPGASQDFIQAEFRKRILPDDLRRKVYGT